MNLQELFIPNAIQTRPFPEALPPQGSQRMTGKCRPMTRRMESAAQPRRSSASVAGTRRVRRLKPCPPILCVYHLFSFLSGRVKNFPGTSPRRKQTDGFVLTQEVEKTSRRGTARGGEGRIHSHERSRVVLGHGHQSRLLFQ